MPDSIPEFYFFECSKNRYYEQAWKRLFIKKLFFFVCFVLKFFLFKKAVFYGFYSERDNIIPSSFCP